MNMDKKLNKKAKSNNKTPKEYADIISQKFKECFDNLNFKYDRFIRTTDDDHVKEVITMWKKLVDNGDIYLENMKDGIVFQMKLLCQIQQLSMELMLFLVRLVKYLVKREAKLLKRRKKIICSDYLNIKKEF